MRERTAGGRGARFAESECGIIKCTPLPPAMVGGRGVHVRGCTFGLMQKLKILTIIMSGEENRKVIELAYFSSKNDPRR